MKNNRKTRKLLTAEENALFCSQISILLKAGISLHDGMKTISETYKGTRYEGCFSKIDEYVRETGSLATAVTMSGMFPDYIVKMIRIGEQTGIMEEVMDALYEYYQREVQVRRAIKNAVLYPLILVAMMAVVIGILAIRVMPIFSQVYASLGVDVSASAETVIRLSSVIGQIILAVVACLLMIVIVLFILFQTKQKDKLKTFLINLFPVAKAINKKISTARFSAVLSKLLEGGFPIEEAIALVAGIIPDQEIAGKVLESQEDIVKGVNFAEAIEKTEMYSDIHIRMLKVAGMSGSTDKTLRKVGEVYDEEVDDGIRRVVSLIEPIIVGILAIIIGAILLSVMLPLASILSVIA